MSTHVTNEVVRMTFEGDEFEKRLSKSVSALQKLKEHMSFKKTNEETEEHLSSMSKALETMAHKAESIWDRTTSKIRDAISNKILGALNEVKDMTLNQLSKGWDKYAEKTEAVATLVGQGFNMETVNEQMQMLNRYTDETSYEFTEMVKSIGKFTAAGQSLEDANLAMQGIANWAALSGANATKASQAMYQLSQAMGKGALKLDDYKSVQNLGMDTQEFRKHTLDAAVTLGTLRKNADDTYTVINDEGKAIDKMTFSLTNFTQNLTDGMWLTSDVMMKVFGEYGSAIEHINQVIDDGIADTATEAIKHLEKQNSELKEEFKTLTSTLNLSEDEIDAALDRWGKIQDVNEEAIDNYLQFNKKATREQAKTVLHQEYLDNLSKFAKEFNLTNEQAQNWLKKSADWTDSFGLKAYKAAQEAKTFRDAIDSVKDAASTQWMNVWEKLFGDYSEARKTWTAFAEFLYDLLVDWLNNINEELDKWVQRGGREILMSAFAELGEAIMAIKELFGEVVSILFGDFTANGFLSLTKNFKNVASRIKEFVLAIKDAGIIQNVAYAIKDVANAFGVILKTFVYGYRWVFPKTAASINPIVLALTKVSEVIRGITSLLSGIIISNAGKVKKLVVGMFSIIQAMGEVVKTILHALGVDLTPGVNEAGEVVKSFADKIFDFIGKVGDWLTDLSKKIRSSDVLDKIFDKTLRFKDFFINNIWPIIKGALNAAWALAKVVGSVFAWLGSKVIEGFKKIPWDSIKEKIIALKETLAPLGEFVKGIGRGFKDGLNSIVDSMSDFNENDERTFFQKILGALSEGFRLFKERVSDAWSAFKDVVKEITQSEGFQKVVGFLKKAFTALKNVFTDYVKPVFLYIWGVISGPVKKILNLLREGKIKEILDLIKSAYQIGALKRIANFFKTFMEFFKDAHLADIIHSISNTFHSISNMFNKFAGVADEARGAIKAWRNERVASTLLKIVIAVALVLGVVFALSFITPERAKKMGEAFVIVLSVALVVIGLLIAVSKAASKGSGSLLSVAAVFTSIALAIILIAKVIKAMGEQFKTNTETMVFGVIAVIGIFILLVGSMLGLIALAGEARAFRDNRLLGIAAIIASFGVAVALIAISFKKMGELKAEDFWQALAGVTVIILALASATWLLNVQKSQKGTMALIGLVLVIRFLLIPILRSIAKNKFDLGQALAAIFIPLVALAGYLFLMSKLLDKEKGMGTVGMIKALLVMAVGLQIIGSTIIPAMSRMSAESAGLSQGAGLLLALLGMAAVFVLFVKVFNEISWGSLLKGAVSLVIGSAALSLALIAFGNAMGAANSSDGFISMGLGMAIVLVAMAGAMALIGQFAPSAIVGASALLILAAAVALLTQAIIAFKKYVLGDDIADIADAVDVTNSKTSVGKPTPGSTKKTVKSGAIQPTSYSKKAMIKAGKVSGEEYTEGIEEGINSTKSKKIQNSASTDVIEEMLKGTNSISSEELLKEMGIDTTDIYVEGLGDYESIDNLLDGGTDVTKTTADGITSSQAVDAIMNGSDETVQNYLNQLLGTSNVSDLQDGGEGVANEIGTGAGNTNMNSSAEDLVQNLIDGTKDPTSISTITSGAEGLVQNLVNGTTNETSNGIISAGVGTGSTDDDSTLLGMFGGLFSNGDMSSSGAALVGSLTGGMTTGSLVDGFISGAVDDIVAKIKKTWNEKTVDLAETLFTPFAWLYDKVTGEDTLDTGKKQQSMNELNKVLQDNYDDIKKAYEYYQGQSLSENKFRSWLITNYHIGGMDDKLAWDDWYNSLVLKFHTHTSGGTKFGLTEEEERIQNYIDKINTAYQTLLNYKQENLPNWTESDQRKLDAFESYLDEYIAYVEETGDTTTKYTDIINSILATEDRMREYYGKNAPQELKGLNGKTIKELINEYKTNGSVMYDMSKDLGSDTAKGFEEGVGDKPYVIGHGFFTEFEEAIKENKAFDINSPSEWAIKIMGLIMEGFAKGMDDSFPILARSIELLKSRLLMQFYDIAISIQSLLDSKPLEIRVIPILDMDNMEYILNGIRFDKNQNRIGSTSYGMSQSVSAPTSPRSSSVNDQLFNQLLGEFEKLNAGVNEYASNPVSVEVYNEVGIESLVTKHNKAAKMNGNKSPLKYVKAD